MQLHRVHGYDMVSCITESYVTSSRTISSSGMHHHIVHMVQCSTVSHISQCMYRVHYVMAQYSTIQCSTSMQYSMYSSATVVQHSTTHPNMLLYSIMYSAVAVQCCVLCTRCVPILQISKSLFCFIIFISPKAHLILIWLLNQSNQLSVQQDKITYVLKCVGSEQQQKNCI